ncbi:flavin-containing monooxygenase [Saccharopolyspora sp. NPDC002578]
MRQPSVAVIGTGFGGLGAAIELTRAGIDDLVIFERGQDVGGVWRENTYPGAACDVPSPFYSYSFELNPNWPRRYSRQPAILQYLREVADKYDLHRYIRFGTEVTAAEYDEATRKWRISTGQGGVVEVDALVSAVGLLSRPSWPDIPGRETFQGASFHSAQWDHDVDLDGKRVAVIGSGASAVQFIPEIQPEVAHLTLFQRSPPYIVPRPDTEFGSWRRRVLGALPGLLRVRRAAWWAVGETIAVSFLYSRVLSRILTAFSRRHMRKQVPDPALFEKVWPQYPVGCKRILFSNDYLPALGESNVAVVDTGIESIHAGGVRDGSGEFHEVDVIIYGTGFTASDFLAPLRVAGAGGRDLREEWSRTGSRAYLGISVPHFPNLYVMYGPNTNVGAGSIVFMLEQQAKHLTSAILHSARVGSPIAVRPEVAAAFDAEVQGRLVDGVWTKCASWYCDASGRISTNWPGTGVEYRRRTADFRPSDYEPVG